MLSLWACSSSPQKAPVSQRKPTPQSSLGYVVRSGDTLYAVGWRFGVDYMEIAAHNKIRAPYNLYPGMRLKIPKPGEAKVAPPTRKIKPKPRVTPATKPVVKPRRPPVPVKKAPVVKPPVKARPVLMNNDKNWLNPTQGKLTQRFTVGNKPHKGVDLGGRLGQPIRAAKSGEVVYAGSGLKAYGLLVIIKHDARYLSAYAFNQSVLVKEGQSVKQGDVIAKMGEKPNKGSMLHFEIRLDGKPQNPQKFVTFTP